MELATHIEKLPSVDPVIDIYSIIAKFLNSIDYQDSVIFPLSKNKFMEIQKKLHEISIGKPFNYNDETIEFDVMFENRLFTFIQIKE